MVEVEGGREGGVEVQTKELQLNGEVFLVFIFLILYIYANFTQRTSFSSNNSLSCETHFLSKKCSYKWVSLFFTRPNKHNEIFCYKYQAMHSIQLGIYAPTLNYTNQNVVQM